MYSVIINLLNNFDIEFLMHLHPLVLLADFSVSEGGFSFLFEPPSGLSFSRFSITVLARMGSGCRLVSIHAVL
jgi:hypothetical protein